MIQLPEIKRQTRSNAQRLRLRIRADGIFLTLPPLVSEHLIQRFLAESQSWMLEHWQKLNTTPRVQSVAQLVDGELLSFPIWEKQWRIQLIAEPSKIIVEQGDCLLISQQHAEKRLKHWVLQQAKLLLPIRLAQLAAKHQFNYRQCTVRHAKSRWGSCSSQGNISLNAALVFLPAALLDYVLLHELCHTRQMNHSKQFWAEMQKVDDCFTTHRQQLLQFKLPTWWYHA
jgi:predicted metal-dependent hydrolase